MNFTNTLTNLFANARTAIQKGMGAFNRAVLVPKGAKHSILNKVVSVGITGIAATVSGFPTWLIVIQCSLAFIASLKARRWFIEVGMVYPFLVIGAITLQPANILTFVVIVTYKYFLEGFCHIVDRIIRAFVAWTSDKKHSYYYFWVVLTSMLVHAVQSKVFVISLTESSEHLPFGEAIKSITTITLG